MRYANHQRAFTIIELLVAKYQNQNRDRFIDNKYKLGRWWDTFYTPSIITVLPRPSEDSLRGHD